MSDCRIGGASNDGAYLLRLEGDVRLTMCTALDEYFDRIFSDPTFSSVAIDVTDATGLDSTVLGMLAKLAIRTKEGLGVKPPLYSCNQGIDRLLKTMGFSQLFELRSGGCEGIDQTLDIPVAAATEEKVREKIIEAHRTLMSMSKENKAAFEDLVKTLESN